MKSPNNKNCSIFRLESTSASNHLLGASLTRAACSGPCPVAFSVSARMEVPQPLGSLFWCFISLAMKRIFLLPNENFLCSSVHPLSLVLSPPGREWLHLLFFKELKKPPLFQAKPAQFSQPLLIPPAKC